MNECETKKDRENSADENVNKPANGQRKEAMTFNSILLFKSNHNTRNNIKHGSFVVELGIVKRNAFTYTVEHCAIALSHTTFQRKERMKEKNLFTYLLSK